MCKCVTRRELKKKASLRSEFVSGQWLSTCIIDYLSHFYSSLVSAAKVSGMIDQVKIFILRKRERDLFIFLLTPEDVNKQLVEKKKEDDRVYRSFYL